MGTWSIWLIIGIPVLVILFAIWSLGYTKVGPNEVLIICGRKREIVDAQGKKRIVGYRMVQGGGTFVIPIKEQARRLSLELMSLDVRTPEVYTAPGVPIMVDGVAQIKVRGDETSIVIAAEQFLSKSHEDIMKTALQTVEGHMRAIIGTLTLEDIYKKRSEFAQRVKDAASLDLAKMGLEIISLTIRNVSDNQGYLEALGKPRIAQVRRDAVIGESEADKEAKMVRYQADTKIEEAKRNYEMEKAQYEADVNQKRGETDLAYDLQKFKTSQLVKREEIQVGIVEKECSIELQEKEVLRKEKELAASIAKPADAEKYRIQALAEAERYRLEAEAYGQAETIRARGFAEAEVIKQKGSSEAEMMHKKAAAWSHYNEAAITEMLVNILPQLAKAVSEPLSKIEKIVVITGGDGSSGASRITRDVAEVIAQLPPVIESLTGIKLDELVRRVGGLKGNAPGKGSDLKIEEG